MSLQNDYTNNIILFIYHVIVALGLDFITATNCDSSYGIPTTSLKIVTSGFTITSSRAWTKKSWISKIYYKNYKVLDKWIIFNFKWFVYKKNCV